MEQDKITIQRLGEMKASGKKITMLTAYSYPEGVLLDKAGIDMAMVGDSLGMVFLGYQSTVPVTMNEIVHHCKAVVNGCKRAFVVADLPFGSYNASIEEAIRNATRLLKEAGADGVKLEGGVKVAPIVSAVTAAGIPVMGHIGVTPQTISQLSGYKVRGKDVDAARALLNDAFALEKAGAFAILLECVPALLAKVITERVGIPTIGIGAGKFCDGQILISYDLLGLFDRFTPKFAKRYVDLSDQIVRTFRQFRCEVQEGLFPDDEHSFKMPREVVEQLVADS